MTAIGCAQVDARPPLPATGPGATTGVVPPTVRIRAVRRLVQATVLREPAYTRHGRLLKEPPETVPVKVRQGPPLRSR